jgi:hypothetical protein
MYSTTSTETLPSRLHSTTSTDLANTQLDALKHYYTDVTYISKDESKYEVSQHENSMLTLKKKCMDHQAPYKLEG